MICMGRMMNMVFISKRESFLMSGTEQPMKHKPAMKQLLNSFVNDECNNICKDG